MLTTPTTERGTAFQRRPIADGASISTAGSPIIVPLWSKLVRPGDVVSAHYRKAATDLWTLVGRQTFTALARDLEVERRPHADVEASGADIWDAADAFRFVYEGPSTSADATITAGVRSLEPTDVWAKAGVMMRGHDTPGSRHVMVIVTPGKGIVMQYRTLGRGASASTPARAGAAPKWVRLTRRGDTFVGETSSDGTAWIEVGRMTIPLMSARVGLAVTSHNNGTLATAAFDDISIWRPF